MKFAIRIDSREQKDLLREWSYKRAHADVVEWCEILIYASMPSLHECWKCKNDQKKIFRGHHEDWCRIKRKLFQNKELTTKKAENVGESGEEDILFEKPEAPVVEMAPKSVKKGNEDMRSDITERNTTTETNEEEQEAKTAQMELPVMRMGNQHLVQTPHTQNQLVGKRRERERSGDEGNLQNRVVPMAPASINQRRKQRSTRKSSLQIKLFQKT